MKVERTICIYSVATDKLIFEIKIDQRIFKEVTRMVVPRKKDMLYYENYILPMDVKSSLVVRYKELIKFLVDDYEWHLQCWQIE